MCVCVHKMDHHFQLLSSQISFILNLYVDIINYRPRQIASYFIQHLWVNTIYRLTGTTYKTYSSRLTYKYSFYPKMVHNPKIIWHHAHLIVHHTFTVRSLTFPHPLNVCQGTIFAVYKALKFLNVINPYLKVSIHNMITIIKVFFEGGCDK